MKACAALEAVLDVMPGPFERGRLDCCAAACLAFERLWGVAVWRHVPPYASRAAALRLIRDHGGPEMWCRCLAAQAGLHTAEPHPGALGLMPPGLLPLTLGLCVGDRWAIKAETSEVVFVKAAPVLCWGAHGH